MADRMQRLVEEGARQVEGQRHLAALAFFGDCRLELAEEAGIAVMAEADAVADCDALAGSDECLPAIRRDALMQRRVDMRHGVAAPALAAQLRRNDLGVVEDQQIAGVEQVGQFADAGDLQSRSPA